MQYNFLKLIKLHGNIEIYVNCDHITAVTPETVYIGKDEYKDESYTVFSTKDDVGLAESQARPYAVCRVHVGTNHDSPSFVVAHQVQRLVECAKKGLQDVPVHSDLISWVNNFSNEESG